MRSFYDWKNSEILQSNVSGKTISLAIFGLAKLDFPQNASKLIRRLINPTELIKYNFNGQAVWNCAFAISQLIELTRNSKDLKQPLMDILEFAAELEYPMEINQEEINQQRIVTLVAIKYFGEILSLKTLRVLSKYVQEGKVVGKPKINRILIFIRTESRKKFPF